jgi:hypothetical protein
MSFKLFVFSIYSKRVSQRFRLGFWGVFVVDAVFPPTAYERVQKRQYTGQIDVAINTNQLHV